MEENEIFLALCVVAAIWGQGRPQKSELRPDGALRAVAYAKVTMAERLENPFDGAGNCYILYRDWQKTYEISFLDTVNFW